MHRVTRIIAAGLAVLTTFGLALMLPSAAGAATRLASGQPFARTVVDPNVTTGFLVYNLTGEDVKYTKTLSRPEGHCGDDILDGGGPPIGSVLHPASDLDFEVIWHPGVTTWCNLYFDVLDASGKKIAQFAANIGINGCRFCQYGQPATGDGSNSPGYQMNISGMTGAGATPTIDLLDPPGTLHNITDGQGQEQAQVLNQLCAQNTDAKCDFNVTKEDLIIPNENDLKSLKTLNPIVPNKTQDDVEMRVSCENSIDVTDSIGGSISAGTKLFGLIEAEISVKYNHEIAAGATFTKELTYTIRPGYEGWVAAGASVYRDWGDFTINMGNTAWHLTNVYFDSPVPDGKQVWEPVTQKLNGGPITEAPVTSQSKTAVAVGAPPVPDQCNQI